MTKPLPFAFALMLAVTAPRGSEAQLSGSTTAAWSPLFPLAELPFTPLSAELALPALLTRPAPRVGLWWTAGVPAALPREIATRRTTFEVRNAATSGRYRRPLEPGRETERLVAGESWGALGGRGAGIGRIVLGITNLGDSTFGDLVTPHRSEPYSVADTLGEEKSGLAVRLEGAGGWRVGPLGFGLTLGYAQRETRTVESKVPVGLRATVPGATLGVAWNAARPLRIAAFARWQQETEYLSILSVAASSRVYRFTGYEDPVPANLTATFYNRRFERAARAGGLAAAGELFGATWTVYGQRELRASENLDVTGKQGRRDRWDADGWAGGAAAQRALGGFLLTAEARYRELHGEAVRADLPDDVVFRADETRWDVTGEARLVSWRQWEAALRAGVAWESRFRADAVVEVHSDISAWRPFGVIEVARRLGRFAGSLALGHAEHNPSGVFPSFFAVGPIYQRWVAPGVEYDATVGSADVAAATVAWRTGAEGLLWLSAGYTRAGTPDPLRYPVPYPGSARALGSREAWRFVLGVAL